MASGGKSPVQEKSVGQQTLEFKKVRANYVDIVKTLEANEGAARSLRRRMVTEGWIDYTATLNPDDLMKVVLGRICSDVSEYTKFIGILGHIVGLDQIKKAIENTVFPVEETCTDPDVANPHSYAITHRRGNGTGGNGKPSTEAMPAAESETTGLLQDVSHSEPLSSSEVLPTEKTVLPGATLMEIAPDAEFDGDNTMPTLGKVAEQSSEASGVSSSVLISGNKSDRQQETLLAEKLRAEDKLRLKEEELAKAVKLVEEYKNKLQEKTQENVKLRKEYNELRRNSDHLLHKKKEAELQCTALRNEVEELKTEVKELNQKVESLEEKAAADKNEVEKMFVSERENRDRRDRGIEDRLDQVVAMLQKAKLPSPDLPSPVKPIKTFSFDDI